MANPQVRCECGSRLDLRASHFLQRCSVCSKLYLYEGGIELFWAYQKRIEPYMDSLHRTVCTNCGSTLILSNQDEDQVLTCSCLQQYKVWYAYKILLVLNLIETAETVSKEVSNDPYKRVITILKQLKVVGSHG